MDKPRTGQAEKRRLRRMILFAAIGVAVVLVSVGISRLQPAAPTAEKGSLFFGKVQRGPMSIEVRGPGLRELADDWNRAHHSSAA